MSYETAKLRRFIQENFSPDELDTLLFDFAQRQNRRDPLTGWLQRIPAWGWGGGVLLGLVAIFLFVWLAGDGMEAAPTVTATPTQSLAASWDPPEIPTFTATPDLTQTPTSTSTPTPTPNLNVPPFEARLGDEWVRQVDEMVMVYVPPPGEPFELGSGVMAPLEEYWIDKYPVTNAQYQLCVDDGVCNPSSHADDTDLNGAEYPVVSISWFDAMDYVGWLNETMPDDVDWVYALPDEAEWEYAAVGETGWDYPWGDEFDGMLLNFCDTNCTNNWKDDDWDDGYAYTSPVGSYPDGASWVGALDMAGNVWEWTDSWWDEAETWRVLRGGSWYNRHIAARAASRSDHTPDNRSLGIGIRVLVHPLPISP